MCIREKVVVFAPREIRSADTAAVCQINAALLESDCEDRTGETITFLRPPR
jgi:hypothetical protein